MADKNKGLTAKERQHFREIILKKREEAMELLEEKRQSFMDNSPTSGSAQLDSNYAFHMADVGTDAQEREKAFMHYTREYKYLNYLNEALNRVDNDPNYGFCVECGNRIPNERLEEVPHTRHCVECKSKIK